MKIHCLCLDYSLQEEALGQAGIDIMDCGEKILKMIDCWAQVGFKTLNESDT